MGTRCICPHCRTTFKVDHIEEMVGTKIRCAQCNGKILIQAPPKKNAISSGVKTAAKDTVKKAAAVKKEKKPNSEIIELDEEAIVVDEDSDADDFAIPDMEYGVDDLAEAELVEEPVQNHRLLAAGRPKQKKKSEGFHEAAGNERSAKRRPVRSSAIFLWIAAGAMALCAVAAVLVLMISGGGAGGGARFQPPQEYVDFSPANLQLSAEIPKGWEKDFGGGQGGVPIHARFSSGKVSIEIRESQGIGAIGGAQIGVQQQGGQQDSTQVAENIHEMHRARIAEDFSSYIEDAEPRPIKTRGFGTGVVSDFDADQGMLGGGRVKGCRATVLNQLHQFNVICKCPASMFEDLQPVFEKIIGSLGG
jgi:DNA-directed RNA polymerase subunit RPC12/RpoP